MQKDLLEAFGNRVRVRVGALIFDDTSAPRSVLLVEHGGLFDAQPFWTPPGGGLRFGESLAEALVREVKEETGLDVVVDRLCYTLDFVRPPLHAVSFYFLCQMIGGTRETGRDPELSDQLIRQVRYVALSELHRLKVVPEGLVEQLCIDAPQHFPSGAKYLGTKR